MAIQEKQEPEKKKVKVEYRIKELHIDKLKGLENCVIKFPGDKSVTAIMGVNGSGKSTILHAISCIFKPKGASSKENNQLSDFFTPHSSPQTSNNWKDSKFHVYFREGTITNLGEKILFTEKQQSTNENEKTPITYSKDKRWTPVYARRPERESYYIGLQKLATLADNTSASRYAEYKKVDPYTPQQKEKIIKALNKILDSNYTDIFDCETTNKGYKTFVGMTKRGVEYTEHSMGAGEKRVLDIVKCIYTEDLKPNGILIIDEIDVLLHERAFHELVNLLVEESKKMCFEVVFTTHRESISKFKNKLNIISLWNIGYGVEVCPGVSADALRQLTNMEPNTVNVFVEDDLAKVVITTYLENEMLQDKVNISLFGSSENVAVVLAGLTLANHNIDTALAVLDGDYATTEKERIALVNNSLSGTDKKVEKEKIRSRIFQFNLDRKDLKGSPEYNHREWLINIDESKVAEHDKQQFLYIKKHSCSIAELDDWHEYYTELKRRTGYDDIEKKVINLLCRYSDKWDFYIKDIKDEIQRCLSKI